MVDVAVGTASHRSGLAGFVLVGTLMCLAPIDAIAGACAPRYALPAINLTTMGVCSFDPDKLSFAGDPVTQAACLVRPVERMAKVGPPRDSLPKVFAERVGRAELLPHRAMLSAYIAEAGLDHAIEESLANPLSRARDNDLQSPMARYFVIHDTSAPRLGTFPPDLDVNLRINNLERFRCSDKAEVAHAFINRSGNIYIGHDFSTPWRATKFERGLKFGLALKGLFVHVELTQPRRPAPEYRRYNEINAPHPGFSPAQYDRLALLYIIASVRAGEWLIPAFHAVIDSEIRGGHDDPQNFDLDSFATALSTTLDRLSAQSASVPTHE